MSWRFKKYSEPPVPRNPCSDMPCYRQLPSYRSRLADSGGEADIVGLDDLAGESQSYAHRFSHDARQCFIQSHVHRCTNTCWKYRGGGKSGDPVRLCHFGFYHVHEVLWYPRRRPERCNRPDCCLKDAKLMDSKGQPTEVPVHPDYCPTLPPHGDVRKFHRHGKALVLPRGRPSGDETTKDYTPHVCVDDR